MKKKNRKAVFFYLQLINQMTYVTRDTFKDNFLILYIFFLI